MTMMDWSEYRARQLEEPAIAAECWCGQPVQQAEDHLCRQCAPHCELAAYLEHRPSPRERYREGASDHATLPSR